MTNGYTDIKNTDMMLIMGGNPAENHPCGFKWAIEAKRVRNAKMIVVDPRFTRTAATADLFLQIRAGSDIAFLGGLIKYAIDNNRLAKDYLINYTNAAFIVKEGFKLPEDGLYSGFNAATQVYDKSTWNYEAGGNVTGQAVAAPVPTGQPAAASAPPKPTAAGAGSAGSASHDAAAAGASGTGGGKEAPKGFYPTEAVVSGKGSAGAPPPTLPPDVAYDLSLQHPRCVFQLLKRQYSRYTPEMVERVTGIPKDQFLKAADLFTSVRKDGDMKKAATIIYAVGWTQHTFGSQIIRAAAILQLMMGNVGRAGGGVNALRGHSNIQGATDMAGIYDNLPGYLKVPAPADTDFATYLEAHHADLGEAVGMGLFQLLVEHAQVRRLLPEGDVRRRRHRGERLGLPLSAEGGPQLLLDPALGQHVQGQGQGDVRLRHERRGHRSGLAEEHRGAEEGRLAGGRRDLSGRDQRVLEVAGDHPGRDEADQHHRLPAPLRGVRREGRLDDQLVALGAVEERRAAAAGDQARLDQDIVAQIFLKVRELYQKEGGKFPDPILKLTWAYTDPRHPSLSEVLKEINGKALADLEDPNTKQQIKAGQQLPGFAWLKDDGTTACGNWLYSGLWTEAGNQTARRGTEDPSGLGIYQNWAWSWPANRRVLYNRASCDPAGKPYDPERRQVWWSEAAKKWMGNDVPDFKADSNPTDHMGPFIMNAEGVGRLFAPLAFFADGPFPEHYEPIESPVKNAFHPLQSNNPVVKKFGTDQDKYAETGGEFDIICTTYRLTEHYHYWTKNNPVNVQLIPEPFVEMPVELAAALGITGGDKVKVTSARSFYVAKAFVTKRIKPMTIDGKKVYQIGIPIHQGYRGIQEDEERNERTLVNRLSPTVYDPNAYTPEFKGFLVKVEKA